jgi:DNA-directed RNA polymerase subunit K/omega
MSRPSVVSHPLVQLGSNTEDIPSRFLLSSIAFLRSKQISHGATARVERNGHKPTYIAILEVLADRISWSHEPLPVPAGGPVPV